ncbi:hypothetical protein B0J14DRAFT_61263 [Halenospora varia]|nr:hypothetical protein B0J14DRAFT_61263 [Halenospora varia]
MSQNGPSSKSPKPGKPVPITLLSDNNQPFIFEISAARQPFRFQFYDTSCPEDWTNITPNLIVLCYDISSRLSLINAQRLWAPTVPTHYPSLIVPMVLLGLKRDLRSETDPNGIIYPQEAYRIAQEMRCDKYMECSAVTGELTDKVWEDVCRTGCEAALGKGNEGGGMSEGGCLVM